MNTLSNVTLIAALSIIMTNSFADPLKDNADMQQDNNTMTEETINDEAPLFPVMDELLIGAPSTVVGGGTRGLKSPEKNATINKE